VRIGINEVGAKNVIMRPRRGFVVVLVLATRAVVDGLVVSIDCDDSHRTITVEVDASAFNFRKRNATNTTVVFDGKCAAYDHAVAYAADGVVGVDVYATSVDERLGFGCEIVVGGECQPPGPAFVLPDPRYTTGFTAFDARRRRGLHHYPDDDCGTDDCDDDCDCAAVVPTLVSYDGRVVGHGVRLRRRPSTMTVDVPMPDSPTFDVVPTAAFAVDDANVVFGLTLATVALDDDDDTAATPHLRTIVCVAVFLVVVIASALVVFATRRHRAHAADLDRGVDSVEFFARYCGEPTTSAIYQTKRHPRATPHHRPIGPSDVKDDRFC